MAQKELHNAIVTRNVEPSQGETLALRGAVFFDAPTLFDGEFPIPAIPCFMFASAPNGAGVFFVPKVGDEIEVEIQVDDPNSPFDPDDVENPEPRYRCMVYSQEADIAEEFKTNYPFRMGWKSNSGHYWLFDDKEGQELVKIFHKVGTFMEWNKDGDWLEEIVRDKVIQIARDLNLTVKGVETKDVSNDSQETIGGKKVFNITGDCEINCENAVVNANTDIQANAGGKAIITASQIELNGAISEATSKQSHQGVIDLITGAPIVPTTTVFLDA